MSMMDSIRRLFARDDADASSSQQAKRHKAQQEQQQQQQQQQQQGGLPVVPSVDRAAIHVPPDYAVRVQRLVAMGWSASLAAQALDSNQFVGLHALSWLQKNHPLPAKPAQPTAAAAASSSSSSAAVAAAASADVPCVFERLPALLAPGNDNYLIAAPPPHSAADAAAASSSSAAASAAAPAMPLVWNCAVCTFENALGSHRCDMCGTVHVASASEMAAHSNLVECCICFEPLSKDCAFAPESAAGCGHYLCVDDARAFLKSRLEGGQISSAGIRCCGDGPCQRILKDSELRLGLTPHDHARLARFQRLHALTSDPSVVFCPTRGCDVVMFGVAGVSRKLTCPDCKGSICFHCRVQWHEGQTCEGWAAHQALLKESGKAKELASGEQLFHQYLQQQGAAFRQCKKCGAWVEKTEGCDKMTCRCGYQFCHKCGIEGAKCHCTPANHVFYDHATVMSNWQYRRPMGW